MGYTESLLGGRKWHYVLSLPAAGYLPSFTAADLGSRDRSVLYSFDTKTATIIDPMTPVTLQREAKHEYFVVAPLLDNGMAVIGDPEKFITMADMRIASVVPAADALRVEVIADASRSPIITGYSPQRPTGVEAGNQKLAEMSSPDRLKAAMAGWFWDPQTRLWQVKVDFADAAKMETRSFRIH